VRNTRIWKAMLGLSGTVVQDVELIDGPAGAVVFDDELHVVAHVRPVKSQRLRCPYCRRRCGKYDDGRGRRRWRALDVGPLRAYLEADAPRVNCPEHGVLVAAVPWARHNAGHTDFFDDTIAWLAVACSKTAITQLMRVTWRTVGNIISRVWNDIEHVTDRLEGVKRIGIDEISYRKGHRYLMVVVDHDRGHLLWAGIGQSADTVHRFFDTLGPDRCAALTHVSADGARWITDVVAERAPQAIMCADPFHIVSWATDALDEVRRQVWKNARQAAGATRTHRHGARTITLSQGDARALRRARYALWKNPEDLTDHQAAKLAWIEKTHPYLHRAYLLKEGLRTVFKLQATQAKQALQRWLAWAARSRIPEYIALGRRIRKHLDAIHASLEHGISNALIESTNTKIRLITRMAFGFASPHNLIALAMLSLGGHRPPLPGRS
jgi:transposase